MFAFAVIILPLCVLVMSAAAIIFAMRGRRVDDHPTCRRCGFDLFGKPEGSTRCAECGADLLLRRSVKVGRREVRRRLLTAVVPLELLSITWIGLAAWTWRAGADVNRRLPVSLLIVEADLAGAGARRDAALAEAARRIRAGKVTLDRVESLVERALAVQGDAGQAWSPGWGFVIEAANDAGKLSKASWERYARQAVTFRLETWPTVRVGDPIPFRIHTVPRVGTPSYPLLRAAELGFRATVGERECAMKGCSLYGFGQIVDRPTSTDGFVTPFESEGPFAAGDSRVVFDVTIYGPPTQTGAISLSAQVSITPRDRPAPVRLVRDAALRQTMRGAIQARAERLVGALRQPPIEIISVESRIGPAPVTLCVAVSVRQGEEDVVAGHAYVPRGGSDATVFSSNVPAQPRRQSIEIVFRPEVDAALFNFGASEIWGEEIVVKVPIRRPQGD